MFRFVEVLLRHAGASGHPIAIYRIPAQSCIHCASFNVFHTFVYHVLQCSPVLFLTDYRTRGIGGALGTLKRIYNNYQ